MRQGTTLADIIRRNTSISDEIPDNVFGGPAAVSSTDADNGSVDETTSAMAGVAGPPP